MANGTGLTMSHRAADVTLDEVRRVRSLQSERIARVRSAAGVQIGAAGIAAGLGSATAENPWWLIPLGFLGASVLAGVITVATRGAELVDPGSAFDHAIGVDALQVKIDTIEGIISEYENMEAKFRWPVRFSRVGTILFLIGIVSMIAVAGIGAAAYHPTGPVDVRVVEVMP